MKTFSFVLIFHVVRVLHCWININMNGFSFSYQLSVTGNCEIHGDRFGFYTGYSINECVQECGLRPHCKTLNYLHNMNVCELFTSGEQSSYFTDGSCFQVKKSDIMFQKTPCGECSYGQACDLSTKRCRASECINITKPADGIVLGNLRAIGDIIRYRCNNGYVAKNRENHVARCLANGTWNASVECIRVCREPYIKNAVISEGESIKGSVRIVTCNYQTVIDVNTVTSDIECSADGTWSPNVTCSTFNNVIFKVVARNGKSAISAWKYGTGSTANKMCRGILSTNECSDHYRDTRIDQWDSLNVKKVRYSVYKNGTEVAWVEFNGTGSNNMDWFQKSRILGSSYRDLNTNSMSNHFGIEPKVLSRFFYISADFNGCKGDRLWFVTIDGILPDSRCWFDLKDMPSVFYSTLNIMGTTLPDGTELDVADIAIVSVKN